VQVRAEKVQEALTAGGAVRRHLRRLVVVEPCTTVLIHFRFATTVTASAQPVGVDLAFVSLIRPALAGFGPGEKSETLVVHGVGGSTTQRRKIGLLSRS
jgi:hypothetical protein